MRLSCAGEARQTHPEGQAKAWSIAVHRGATVVAIATASEAAFDLSRFNELSSAVTDALVLPEGADPWLRAWDCLRARQAELGDDWEVSVSASAIRLHAAAGTVGVSWLGGMQAILVRAGAVLHRTLPHTLGRELRRQGLPEAANADVGAFIITRCLTSKERAAPEEVTWLVQPGDRILVMSLPLVRRRDDARVRRAAQRPSPGDAAADLLGDEEGGDPPVGCVVVVVDVDET
jgi:hypothetical protein